MLRDDLLGMLAAYSPCDAWEAKYKAEIVAFVEGNEVVLGRGNPTGHLTASAWIVNRDLTKALLTHHKALGIWVQLGGHTDEGEQLRDAALREAREESGLLDLRLRSEQIFDLDVHLIPARNGVQAHYHYDIRFLLEADDQESLTVSLESRDLRWLPLAGIGGYNAGESIQRMVRKTRRIRS